MQDKPEKVKEIYKNREISWLQFNERVLEEAEDESTPLLERLRFLSIVLNNSDEFYRVRVGMLCDQMLVDENIRDDKAGRTISEQLKDIWSATRKLRTRFDAAYAQVMTAMENFGVCQIRKSKRVAERDKSFLKNLFEQQIAPLLAPFIIEKNHPFPFFENGKLVVGVTLKTKNGKDCVGLIPLPDSIERMICLPSEACRFILAEDLILMFADRVFHKFDVQEKAIFSIIRNADINEDEGLYDYDTDLSDTMSKIIDRRKLMGPVKIKYNGDNCPKLISYLSRVLYLKKRQIFQYGTPLDFRFLSELENRLSENSLTSLCFPPHVPAPNPNINENGNIIEQIIRRDILLAYPFEDVSAMLALMRQAAADNRVKSIHITLYRVAHHSKIVSALIDAANNGKQVTCVIELRARFDEENNIDWAGQLREAGCKVLYGMPGYKTHAKLLLIELADGKNICLIGTGNFNEITAHVYTDISLLTAHRGIVADVQKVFAAIESGTFVQQADHLLVAPLCMKNRLIEMIDGQIEKKLRGKPAEIVMKLNSLTEKEMIDKLIEASGAGVKVRLIVRGICCVIPGIPGVTENIAVRSIVGRFLEHSRIYAFGVGRRKQYFISSADLMTRNMTGRVEVAVPIYDPACQAKLRRILNSNFADNGKARILQADGRYKKVTLSRWRKPRNSQQELSGIEER